MRVVNASSFLSVVNQKEMDSSAVEIIIFSLLRMLKQPFSGNVESALAAAKRPV